MKSLNLRAIALTIASFVLFTAPAGIAFAAPSDSTSISVACSPASLAVGETTACTATVTNTKHGSNNGSPLGSVAFTFSGAGAAGSFTGSPCTLSAAAATTSTCAATFAPTAATPTSISGAYTSSDTSGNGWGNSGPSANFNLTIAKGSQTITVTTHAPASAAYGSSFSVAATAPGGAVAITTTGGCSNTGGTVTMTSATDACTVHYNQAGSSSYNAAPEVTESTTAAAAPLTVTGITASNRDYDGSTDASLSGSGSLVGKVGSDAVSLTGTPTGAFADKNAGTGKTVTISGLSLTGADAAKYTLTSPTTTADINKLAITIAAAANTKEYDGTTSVAATPTVTPGIIVSGDTPAFTESYDTKNVGTGKTLTPSGIVNDGSGGNNYSYTFNNDTTGVITARAITVTAAANSKEYDGTTDAAALPTITSGTLAGGDSLAFTESYDTKNVGTGKTLTPSGSVSDGNGGANYAVTLDADTTGVITAKALTVTGITASSRPYDGTTNATLDTSGAALGAGVVGGDAVSLDVSGATGAFVDKNVGTGKTVDISGLSLTDANAGNYTLTPRRLRLTSPRCPLQ